MKYDVRSSRSTWWYQSLNIIRQANNMLIQYLLHLYQAVVWN